jgi:hypothetical protein
MISEHERLKPLFMCGRLLPTWASRIRQLDPNDDHIPAMDICSELACTTPVLRLEKPNHSLCLIAEMARAGEYEQNRPF